MADKSKGKWAESASGYKPGSSSARSAPKATRPWHVPGTSDETTTADEAPVTWSRTLPITAIETDPDQPRRTFVAHSLDELASSIRSQGVLQPILVRRLADGSGTYVVVAGERRLRAARAAGLENVPCVVLAGESLRDARLAQLAENLQREDLAPMEEAHAIVRLAEVDELSHEEVAKRLGKSPAYISRIYSVSRIPSTEYKALATSQPSMSVLYEYAQLPEDPALRRRAAEMIRDGATVRDLEALRGKGGRSGKSKTGGKPVRRGRPMKADAQVEALRRAVRGLGALSPDGAARAIGTSQRDAIIAEQVSLARWTARVLGGNGAIEDAARQLETALTRASGAKSSTPAGTAGRAGRKAPSTRPR